MQSVQCVLFAIPLTSSMRKCCKWTMYPDATVAITHDEEWSHVLENTDEDFPTDDLLLNYIKEKFQIVSHDGYVHLQLGSTNELSSDPDPSIHTTPISEENNNSEIASHDNHVNPPINEKDSPSSYSISNQHAKIIPTTPKPQKKKYILVHIKRKAKSIQSVFRELIRRQARHLERYDEDLRDKMSTPESCVKFVD
ncbi:hypothetical protein K435DRAFT_380179 [Dendrothele bispora CBS 962.96]|uniref:Uncharacterized protein n=1 Tax=Dendrothele bispora (strain CBS 962.96) TaxID=1314807 RepID=A0A4S8MV95_DENBC|nr:hypothetical protein K435DRAFT_380179 [Dendrothele bispora CBS 962.96]